ncbi:MAG TPA: 50S ribosomal protein L18 [Alphaproteobacteria bacterium]|nr:50S ribosomal protein L18 [Alphaproteobacteria bacterium]
MSHIDPKLARKYRVRARLRRIRSDRPRLAVHRSSHHIYAQVIDDKSARTLAAASTLDPKLREEIKSGANLDAAKAVGKLVAERAKAAGITEVRFDRGGYIFHGRVRALADAAREAGLNF